MMRHVISWFGLWFEITKSRFLFETVALWSSTLPIGDTQIPHTTFKNNLSILIIKKHKSC